MYTGQIWVKGPTHVWHQNVVHSFDISLISFLYEGILREILFHVTFLLLHSSKLTSNMSKERERSRFTFSTTQSFSSSFLLQWPIRLVGWCDPGRSRQHVHGLVEEQRYQVPGNKGLDLQFLALAQALLQIDWLQGNSWSVDRHSWGPQEDGKFWHFVC